MASHDDGELSSGDDVLELQEAPVEPVENVKASAEAETKVPTADFLCCDKCDAPVCDASEFFVERVAVWDATVYAYQLDDVMSHQNVWCYSATNPSERRFDVARVRPSAHKRGLFCQGAFSNEHSWFPGHEWCMCMCQTCGQHMGWGFRKERDQPTPAPEPLPQAVEPAMEEEPDASPSAVPSKTDDEDDSTSSSPPVSASNSPPLQSRGLEFIGLILTHTNSKTLPIDAREKVAAEANDRFARLRQYESQRREVYRILRAMPDQLLANRFGMVLMQIDHTPQLRPMLPAFLAQVRAAATPDEPAPEQPQPAPPVAAGNAAVAVAQILNALGQADAAMAVGEDDDSESWSDVSESSEDSGDDGANEGAGNDPEEPQPPEQ